MQFTKDDEGDKPELGQFTVPSMSPFTEQLRTAASGFAGETGLTLDDLGFPSDNPSSAEAIKASHETLRLMAEKAKRDFGLGFLNAGYLAACVRDNYPYQRYQLYQTKPKWEPIFKPDASAIATIGDGINKINQAVPNYFDKDSLRDLIGIDGSPVAGIPVVEETNESSSNSEQDDSAAVVQGKMLNGAQTLSLIAIMSQYTSGAISEGQAVNLISTAIGISKAEARAILQGDLS